MVVALGGDRRGRWSHHLAPRPPGDIPEPAVERGLHLHVLLLEGAVGEEADRSRAHRIPVEGRLVPLPAPYTRT